MSRTISGLVSLDTDYVTNSQIITTDQIIARIQNIEDLITDNLSTTTLNTPEINSTTSLALKINGSSKLTIGSDGNVTIPNQLWTGPQFITDGMKICNNGSFINTLHPIKVMFHMRVVFTDVKKTTGTPGGPGTTHNIIPGSNGTIVNPFGVNKDIDIYAGGGDGATVNYKGVHFRWDFPYTLPSSHYFVQATAGSNEFTAGNTTQDVWEVSVGQHDVGGCSVWARTQRQNGLPVVGTGITTFPENPLVVSLQLVHTGQ